MKVVSDVESDRNDSFACCASFLHLLFWHSFVSDLSPMLDSVFRKFLLLGRCGPLYQTRGPILAGASFAVFVRYSKRNQVAQHHNCDASKITQLNIGV